MEGNNNFNFFDVVVLEFDFMFIFDSIFFDFVFVFEEYCDFLFFLFIDLFGFFISGLGINGLFINNGINMVVVFGIIDFIIVNIVSFFINF